MEKKFGLFKICAKWKQHKDEIAYHVWQNFILQKPDNGASSYFLTSYAKHDLVDDKNDYKLQSLLQAWRENERREQQLSLSHTYTTKWFIHQCDELGMMIPTATELKNAVEWAKEHVAADKLKELLESGGIREEFVDKFAC